MTEGHRYSRARVRTGVKHFLLGKAISSVAGFAALLLVVRGLSVTDFATYSVLFALIEVLTALSGFGLVHAVLRFVPELYVRHSPRALPRLAYGTLAIRSAVLSLVTLCAYMFSGTIAGWMGLAAREPAFIAYLVVVLVRSSAHFVSQILESTLHQGYSQAGFTATALVRLLGLALLISSEGSLDLLDVIWIEAASDAVGLTILAIGLVRVLAIELRSKASTDDRAWITNNWRRIARFSLAGYLQHLSILPYGGHTSRLLGGRFLAAPAMASFGLAQSLFDYVKRYLPAQLLIGVIRPAIVARFSETKDFLAVNRATETVMKVNGVLTGLLVALLLVAGSDAISFGTGGKYGAEVVPLLLAFAAVLLLETFRQQLEVVVQAVERYDYLISSNLLLSSSALAGVAGLPIMGASAFPLGNGAGLLLGNYWVIRKLRREGYFYSVDWQSWTVIAVSTLVGTLVGLGARMAADQWWLGIAGAACAYGLTLLTLDLPGLTSLWSTISGRSTPPVSNATRNEMAVGATAVDARLVNQLHIGGRLRRNRQWLLAAAYREIFLDIGRAHDAILVAGTGRSGTTWVGDVIANAIGARIVFEPFILGSGDRFLHLDAYEYDNCRGRLNYSLFLDADDARASSYLEQISNILAGRIRGFWVNQESRPGIFTRRVIKDIRANLMLPFLVSHWPELKVIHVVRSPLAVVDSMLAKSREGWGFDWAPEDVLGQHELMERWLEPYRQIIQEATAPAERLAVRWCIENFVVLQNAGSMSSVLFVRYEDLRQGTAEWLKIFQHIGYRRVTPNAIRHLTARPSHTTSRGSFNGPFPKQYSHLTPEQADAIKAIVHRFNLEAFL